MQLTDAHLPTPKTPSSLPLPFAPALVSLETWEDVPDDCCLDWLGSKGLSRETGRVYLSMWSNFTRWRRARRLLLREVEDFHLKVFLDELGLVKHHRYRYIRLIERIYDRLAELSPGLTNPGRQAAIKRIGAGMNAPSMRLSVEQRNVLIEFLVRHYMGEGVPSKGKNTPWRVRRDFAIAAVMVGAGMKVGEIREASVNCVMPEGDAIEVSDEKGRWHRARVLPFARPILAGWLAYRAETETAGVRLFPSSVKGESMDHTTLYRRAHKLIEMAGVSLDSREAPTTLRNTYAAILFDQGESDEAVARYLGLSPGSSARIRLALTR